MSDLLCPIKPCDMDKPMRRGMESIVERVTAAAVIYNSGRNLLLLVYMAGLHHGFQTVERLRDSGSDPKGRDALAAPGEASQSGGAISAASPNLNDLNPVDRTNKKG